MNVDKVNSATIADGRSGNMSKEQRFEYDCVPTTNDSYQNILDNMAKKGWILEESIERDKIFVFKRPVNEGPSPAPQPDVGGKDTDHEEIIAFIQSATETVETVSGAMRKMEQFKDHISEKEDKNND